MNVRSFARVSAPSTINAILFQVGPRERTSAEIKRNENSPVKSQTQKIVRHYKNLTVLSSETLYIFLDARLKSVPPKRLYLFPRLHAIPRLIHILRAMDDPGLKLPQNEQFS